MKGVVPFLVGVLVIVIGILAYYNLKQQQTIQLLNEEIFEQARLRHNLVIEKHGLEKQIEKLAKDTLTN